EKPEDTPQFPSLVGCLDFGMIGFTPAGTDTSLTSLLPEVGMSAQCKVFPVVRPKAELTHEITTQRETTSDQIEFFKVTQPPGVEFVEYDGSICPVKKVGNDYMAIDQGRLLLNYLLLLNELLSLKTINPDIKFSASYLQGVDRFHFAH